MPFSMASMCLLVPCLGHLPVRAATDRLGQPIVLRERMPGMKLIEKNQLAIFLLATYGFCAAVVAYAMSSRNMGVAILAPLSPSVIAIGIALLAEGKSGFRKLVLEQFRFRFSPAWYVYCCLLLPLVILVAVLLQGAMAGEAFALLPQRPFPAVVVILLIAFGEEIGWRGFLQPRLLERFPPMVAFSVTGVIWGLWHYPGHLAGVGVPLGLPFPVFMVWVITVSIYFGRAYLATRSLVTAILLHSSANASFAFLPLLPEWTGETTSFYLMLAVLWLGIGLMLLMDHTLRPELGA